MSTKAFLACATLLSVCALHADEYQTLYGGTFLSNLNTLGSGYRPAADIPIYTLAGGTSSVYYPGGWTKFKLYFPGGTYSSTTINILPNSTARIHLKYNKDEDSFTQTIDHKNPISGIGLDASGSSTIETIATDAAQFSFNNTGSRGGWLYIDIVSDCAHYACQYNIGSATARVTQEFYKLDPAAYNTWLTSTNFLTQDGDPSANNGSMNIIDVPDATLAPVTRVISLDNGGNPSSYSPASSASSVSSVSSSVASVASVSSIASSVSSDAGSSYSAPTQTCPSGSVWSGINCIPVATSSTATVSSSTASSSSSATNTCVSGGALPGPGGGSTTTTVCSSSSVSSSSSSKASSSSSSSKASSSSSSKASDANLTSKSLTLQPSWNLISLPLETNDVVDVNKTLSGKATIGWKFKFISDVNASYAWEKWLPGTAMTLSNGEGLFVGVPTAYGTQTIDFNVTKDSNITKFNEMNFITGKWYLLGFSYDLSMSSIKSDLNASFVAWIQENGAYKKLDENATINAGQGFWFKKK